MVLFISPPFGNYLTFLPGTVPISGSFTLEPRPGLLHQIMSTLRYNFEHGGWVNKIGLRNKGIHYGLNNFSTNDVLSIAIKKDDDVAKLNEIIPRDRNIEINVSCPNTSIRVPKDLGVFVSEERRWCIIKLIAVGHRKAHRWILQARVQTISLLQYLPCHWWWSFGSLSHSICEGENNLHKEKVSRH